MMAGKSCWWITICSAPRHYKKCSIKKRTSARCLWRKILSRRCTNCAIYRSTCWSSKVGFYRQSVLRHFTSCLSLTIEGRSWCCMMD
ncbi:Uncharacterised protein [Vibrio cholerae]|nr:Uncharacterised protein [Vibrio cholerae]